MNKLEWLKEEEKFTENGIRMRKERIEEAETRLKIIKELIRQIGGQSANTEDCPQG